MSISSTKLHDAIGIPYGRNTRSEYRVVPKLKAYAGPRQRHNKRPYELKVCRICFAMDRALLLLNGDEKLYKGYEAVTGLTLADEEDLPPYLCTSCADQLMRCARFRHRSLQAHLMLLDILKNHGHITLQSIREVNKTQTSINYDNDTVHAVNEIILTDVQAAESDVTIDIIEPEINNVNINCGEKGLYGIKTEINDLNIICEDNAEIEPNDANPNCEDNNLDRIKREISELNISWGDNAETETKDRNMNCEDINLVKIKTKINDLNINCEDNTVDGIETEINELSINCQDSTVDGIKREINDLNIHCEEHTVDGINIESEEIAKKTVKSEINDVSREDNRKEMTIKDVIRSSRLFEEVYVPSVKVNNLINKDMINESVDDDEVKTGKWKCDINRFQSHLVDQPDESMDFTDPSLLKSNVSKKQDVAASTSAKPFARPSKTAPKSKAQRQREYRERTAASRTYAQVMATRKSNAERQRNYRRRRAAKSAKGSVGFATVSHSGSKDVETGCQELIHQQRQTSAVPAKITVQPGADISDVQKAQSTWKIKWAFAILRLKSSFLDNDFGYACSICDRLWFKNDVKPLTAAQLEVMSELFAEFMCKDEYEMVCNTCKRSLNRKSMPPLAKINGFSYPDQPPGLPPLDPISERLISPRLPFNQVRRLRNDSSSGIIGQVINVPVDVQEMVTCLPRQLNEDDVINVNIKRNLAHKSDHISGYMYKSTISAWLNVLQKTPLYRMYEIDVDMSKLHVTKDDPSNRIEDISAENTPETEILSSRQHTMLWNEEDCVNIAPGHQATPPNTIYDRHAEELSFPSIYFGEPRSFNKRVTVTPYMIATSEIRRRDRRGATPQKILYVAMKILRLRMLNGIHNTFRNVSATENVTRRMLEDTEFLKEYVIQNLAFMKTVPNSVQYWASRKRDLFALIRQLGKPTVFLSISANEIHWMKLLTILLKLSEKYPGKTAKDLNTSERCTLVSDDPVTCCIYFYRLVGSLMKMLKSKQSYNPFGKYFVKDYFLRIGFEHRGSPYAHILLWLNNDPRETVSEYMPKTIDLVERLTSVSRNDVPNNSVYANQTHKHTFTCTKRGETTCGIPYWPMSTTRILIPIPQSDGRHQTLQQKAKELRTSLGERRYACMDEFLNANGLTYVSYLDIVRSTLSRPTLMFRRNFDELMTNTFNPYLAGELSSKIDIQFILDEYSCSEYVVEYVNKTARGMSDLRRELITMMQEHPYQDYTGQLKALSNKLLNAVEMSAQEAAWYLLRQPMSETSRQVVYIPTVWPTERQRCRKRRRQMDREGIDEDSTDVWTKNIIQRYEERPATLEQVYLAEFASWYANTNDFVDEEDDGTVDDDEDSEAVPEARTWRLPKECRRQPRDRVIRYRHYDIDDTVNYKREMVLLYVQFRNEMSEVVDQNKFLQLFDDNKDTIVDRHSLFENLNFGNVMKEVEAVFLYNDDNNFQQPACSIDL